MSESTAPPATDQKPLNPIIIRPAPARAFMRSHPRLMYKSKPSGFRFGFGLGCGLIAALILVPAIALFLIFGGLGLIFTKKGPIEVKPEVQIKEPFTSAIAESIEEAKAKKKARLSRLEGEYLTGLGELINKGNGCYRVNEKLLHERANCPFLVEGLKYYKPLYITVRNGRFVGDNDSLFYDDDRALCDRCVQ